MEHPDVTAEWVPIGLDEAADLFRPVDAHWWVAGGWAIDLFVGHQTRSHGDLDIQVLRRDQLSIQKCLRGWQLYAADPPGSLRLWREFEVLPAYVHDIWCRSGPASPWMLQLMLADSRDETWIYRRDRRIERPLSGIGRWSASGFPYLAPEIQLLHKAKQTPLDKDEVDFAHAMPLLDGSSRSWLRDALMLTNPHHPWVPLL